MKNERSCAIQSKMADEISNLEFLNKTMPDSPKSDNNERSGSRSFESAKPLELEIEEGREEELSRYLNSSRRRETIAHIPETSGRRRSLFPIGDSSGIPEISVCHSPSPPHLNDTSQLQYKEKYLPRPAVLNVRPTFDRRASDGSATLQDSIAQFNLLRTLSKATPGGRYGKDGSRNMLSVPENETTGSESDNEQDFEAAQYLANRGSRNRRTLGTIFPSTPEEVEDASLHKAFQKRPLKMNAANRASPIPYMTVSDPRRISDSIPKGEDKETFVHVLEQHKKLKDQFAGGGTRRSSASLIREQNTFRHSYPFNEGEPDLSSDDPNLLKLRRKQEAQLQDLDVKFMVQKKILETKMAQQRQELIRRASEGAPMLENSIAMFLRKHEGEGKIRSGTGGTAELQDEMKKLNMNASSATDLPSFEPSDSPPQRLSTGGMDIDEMSSSAADMNSHYNFAGIFKNQEPRLGNNFLPLSSSNYGVPRMRPSFPGMEPPPHLWSDRETVEREASPLIENVHESLSRTMSYDLTFSRSLNEISDLLRHSFEELGVEYQDSGNTYYSLFKDGIQMEVEINPLTGDENGVYNVKFRRVGGDVWPYKKLRDEIVAIIRL